MRRQLVSRDPNCQDPRALEQNLLVRLQDEHDPELREKWASELLVGRRRAIFIWCHKQEDQIETAEDLAQEVLTKALLALRDPDRQIRDFGAWIFTLTRNHCANHRRSCARRPVIRHDIDPEELSSHALGAELQVEQQEQEALLLRWMTSHLTKVERTALWMRTIEEFSLDRIAELLNLGTRDTARVILQRARRRLLRAAGTEREDSGDHEGEVQA